ncbi:MAG: hypothetical protein D6723_09560 [Acidobacteria bacterium]|nr:MAG: hypothetical protein D6723_09560 [Acidobacteriota bacterium]
MNHLVKKLLMTCFSFLTLSAPVFAQGEQAAGPGDDAYRYIAIGFGMGIAAGLAALGDGRAISSACEGIARNPSAGARVQTAMLIGVVFIETLIIFTFAMIWMQLGA